MIGRLVTDRLLLRPTALEDADLFPALDSDPEVMRYLTGGRATPRSDIVNTIRNNLGARWTAFARATDAFVGWFEMVGNGNGDCETGYRLRRASWGAGLATEGTRALIAAAFTDLGARRVSAQTMAVNTRSRRVMERCGLRYLRTFHLVWDDPIAGTEFGEVEYELRRADWLKSTTEPTT